MPSLTTKEKQRIRDRVRSIYRFLREQFLVRFRYETYLEACIDAAPDDEPDWESQILLLASQTKRWVKRGRKINVYPNADLPLPEGKRTHFEYDLGCEHLSWRALRQFRKMVEDAEYERDKRKREKNEMWVKWVTMAAAIIAALGSIIAALKK